MLKIYNTLTHQKEDFIPVRDREKLVRMYVCGITPYDEVHLGHARCYVIFDVIRRYLKYKGYNVKYVQNFTDIDDKIIKRSKELDVKPSELAEKYIQDYFAQMQRLNVLNADAYPRVTEKIPEIIKFIEKIIQRGYGYVAGGDVYFSVRKFPKYGQLSRRDISELKIGARIQPDEQKNDSLDFALWKKAKENEPSWDSPWGRGRPGWHIECSVMSLNELGGDTLDIHGGGQDLIFPHHENEIAQSEAVLGKLFVKYWIHNGFVTINKEKMSKSLGNFFTLREIFEKYDPMIVRYMLLSQHYRQPLDFSDDKLQQARSAYERILNVIFKTTDLIKSLPDGKLETTVKEIADAIEENFQKSMDDDFNTAEALSSIHMLVNHLFILERDRPSGLNKAMVEYNISKLYDFLDVLGLKVASEMRIPEEILTMIQEREQARRNKNFWLADEIREKIRKSGFIIEDTKFGPRLKKM